MKGINKKVIDKAKTRDKQIINQQFADLKILLDEAGFRFKSNSDTELIIDIGLNEKTDIEIYPFGGFYKRFIIILWYPEFKSNHFKHMSSDERRENEHKEASSLVEVMDCINKMIHLFDLDEKYLKHEKL